MGHNEHFLERAQQRLDFHQMDRAMSLYRDPTFVRDLLAILKLSDGVPRVALELELGDDGPYVVVDRNGTLVTCLAKGMGVSALRVVRKAELDGLFARGETLRARQRALEAETAKEGGSTKLTARLIEGAKVSRETIRALLALVPLQGFLWYRAAMDLAVELEVQRQRLLARHGDKIVGQEGVERFSKLCWTHANLFALSLSHGIHDELRAMPELNLTGAMQAQVTLNMANIDLLGPFQRGLWTMASLGGEALPEVREQYRACWGVPSMMATSLAAFGIGLRSKKVRGEVRKLLEKGPQSSGKAVAPELLAALKGFTQTFAKWIDLPPSEGKSIATNFGQKVVFDCTRTLPEGHALRFDSFEAVPTDWAAAYLYNQPDMPWRTKAGLNVLTTCSIHFLTAPLEELFLPEPALELIPDWDPIHGEALVRDLGRDVDPRTVVAAPKVGRNDPCACGSGEKYKKCCMGKAS